MHTVWNSVAQRNDAQHNGERDHTCSLDIGVCTAATRVSLRMPQEASSVCPRRPFGDFFLLDSGWHENTSAFKKFEGSTRYPSDFGVRRSTIQADYRPGLHWTLRQLRMPQLITVISRTSHCAELCSRSSEKWHDQVSKRLVKAVLFKFHRHVARPCFQGWVNALMISDRWHHQVSKRLVKAVLYKFNALFTEFFLGFGLAKKTSGFGLMPIFDCPRVAATSSSMD